tara:strand:+ start:262 stop:654 length:393 start_codon:yes stop_codon:yes gene_type:complete
MKIFFLLITFLIFPSAYTEVNSWECSNLEGSKIVSADGAYLGELGPNWQSDSIFNDSSEYSSSWSSESIYNSSTEYGNSYSQQSVFNDSASNPPSIINDSGEEIGKLSVGPSWDSSRLHPSDIKYTCDWD